MAKKLVRNALLLSVIAAASAGAAPSKVSIGKVKDTHPHLYADAESFKSLKEQLPMLERLPRSGSLTFVLTPGRNDEGKIDRMVFGDSTQSAGFYIRHTSDETDATGKFQFVLHNGATALSAVIFEKAYGETTTIKVTWNMDTKTATFDAGSATYPGTAPGYRPKPIALPDGWTPSGMTRLFSGRLTERFSAISVKDSAENPLWTRAVLDPHMVFAWNDFSKSAFERHHMLAQCNTATTPAKFCNTATGDRGDALRAAQIFALMYRLTGDPTYLTDAKTYAERIIATNESAGGEWSANGRLAALAIIYDWLYPELFKDDKTLLARIVNSIKSNIVAPQESGSDRYPMMKGICGKWSLLSEDAVFDCPNDIVYEDWDANIGYSISNEYIGGHPTANVASVSMALLAIAGERPEVKPMLATMATHYQLGFWKAMREIAADGGHHQSWGYTASMTPAERLLVWQTSLIDGSPFPSEPWANKMILPYLYGYRGRSQVEVAGEFPASGDAFRAQSWLGTIGQLARSAAIQGKEPAAAYFYNNIVLPQRSKVLGKEVKDINAGTGTDTLLEKLYWPDPLEQGDVTAAALPDDLSKHFKTAGRVLARDTWEFEKATLFEFKSTSFASIQHHHLDQNSFTLYYKGPLALDTGVYDDYGSPHWHNYYIRSIAHNTITVFDEDEVVTRWDPDTKQNVPLSNDGGQWFVNGQVKVPTIENIEAGGINRLHGVEAYESGKAFTYVRGNASASYSSQKLDNAKGFIRSSVFLQPTPQPGDGWKKPVLIVYDQVRTKKNLLPTFLLHTEAEPYSATATNSPAQGGRSSITFPSTKRILAVQNVNKGAMVVQTLLPTNATFIKAGGLSNGQTCKQIQANRTDTIDFPDCRFTARLKVGNNFEWFNFRPTFESDGGSKRREDIRETDKGNWRIEITPTAYAPTMEFLNVFSIKDVAAGDNLEPVATTRVGKGTNTEAVRIGQAGGTNLTVAFNKGGESTLEWEGSSVKGIIAVGLVPNQTYAVSSNGTTVTLSPAASGERSSADGVLYIE